MGSTGLMVKRLSGEDSVRDFAAYFPFQCRYPCRHACELSSLLVSVKLRTLSDDKYLCCFVGTLGTTVSTSAINARPRGINQSFSSLLRVTGLDGPAGIIYITNSEPG